MTTCPLGKGPGLCACSRMPGFKAETWASGVLDARGLRQRPNGNLRASLRGFQSGTRPGYTQAMTAAVSQVPVEDLDILAYYLARFPGAAAK